MNKKSMSEVVNLFLKIVQIDSLTGEEKQLSLYVKEYLDGIGLEASVDKEGNVLAFLEGNNSLEPYILNAHLDTVEPGRGIKPKINDEWIESSGETILGADNKTAVAAILTTVKGLASLSNESRRPIEIIFTTSEESGNKGAVSLDYSKIKSKVGYSFDMSSLNLGDIMVSSPFYNRIDIEIIGKSGHAKYPEKAVNVLPVFAGAVTNLKLGRISENTLANLGIIRIGEAVNSIPGRALISGEVRSTVEDELEEITGKIINTFKKSAKNLNSEVKSKVTRENGGFKYDKEDPFVKETVKKIGGLGIKPELINSFGCADANIFAEHGIKILNIADGSRDAHTVNERVRVKDLEGLVQLILEIVRV